MRLLAGLALTTALLAGTAHAGSEAAIDTVPQGFKLFGERCAACHDHPSGRIPPHYALSHLTADQVVQALTAGPMRQQATGLSQEDIRQLAVFITYKNPGQWSEPDPRANICKAPAELGSDGPKWTDWGLNPENTRFNSESGIAAADVPRLVLKWAFALPGSEVVGQPTRAGNLLFVPSGAGRIFALDARTGCTYWTAEAGAPVKTAITLGPGPGGKGMSAYFGDMSGAAHAVDALTGKALWAERADAHPLAQVRGTPQLYQGRLYTPVSSGEEAAAADPAYPCCTFRGALVAFDAATGKIVWKAYAIPDEPAPFKMNSAGTQMYGPAGAGTWASPTIDARHGRIYIGTGNGLSGKDPGTTDAVMAFDLKTGKRLWATQGTQDDIYVVCQTLGTGNCPDKLGGDVDFGSATVLDQTGGRQLLLAGQKSGAVFAFDPGSGKIVWRDKLGVGGAYGGIEHGIATDGRRVYVPISDIKPTEAVKMVAQKPHPEGGIFALDALTGKTIWHIPAPPAKCAWGPLSCSAAQPATPTAIPGVVFSGALDGHIRAYAAEDGHVVWDFDTGHTFPAVNGGEAHGGAVTGYGGIVSGGILYVESGGGYYGPPGNALLAFGVDGN